MKKIVITFYTLLLAASVMMAQTTEEANASKTIDMTNSVIDMYNNYLSNMKKVREGLEKSADNVERLKKNPNTSAYGYNCANFTIRSSEISAYQTASKATPSFPEKAKIQESTDFVIANNEEFAKRCAALSEYFTKKQYADDAGFAQFEVLFNSLDDMYTAISDSWDIATDLSSDAGDRSEVILLKNSPIVDFIVPMKEDLSRVKKLIDKLYQDDIDMAAIKTDISAIETAAQKNRSMEGKKKENLEKYSYPSYHTSFYAYLDDLVKEVGNLQETLNADDIDQERKNQRMEYSFYAINRSYEGMIESYNEM